MKWKNQDLTFLRAWTFSAHFQEQRFTLGELKSQLEHAQAEVQLLHQGRALRMQRPGAMLTACRGKRTLCCCRAPSSDQKLQVLTCQCLSAWHSGCCAHSQLMSSSSGPGMRVGLEPPLSNTAYGNCGTVACINRITEWLGLEEALKIVQF